LTEGVDLDGEVRRVDPDRWLASRFIADPARRADVIALYAFDHELARATQVASNALMAEIRLAWWREAVEEIFAGGQVRRHPTVLAMAAAVNGRRLPRAPFNAIIEARIGALETPRFDLPGARAWAAAAEGSLSRLAALVLGAGEMAARAEPAGTVWGLMLLRRADKAGGDDYDADLREALAEARRAARGLPAAAFPAVLCATLARGDLGRTTVSEVGKRARLTWAALSGRL